MKLIKNKIYVLPYEGQKFNLVCTNDKKIRLDGDCRCELCGRVLQNGYEFALDSNDEELYYFGIECIKNIQDEE